MSDVDKHITDLEKEVLELETQLMKTEIEAMNSQSKLIQVYDQYEHKENEYNELSEKSKKMGEELSTVDGILTSTFARYRKAKQNLHAQNNLKTSLKTAIKSLTEAEVELDKKIHKQNADTEALVKKIENEHNHDILKLKSDISQMQNYLKVCETKKQILQDDLQRKENELKELTDICDELVKKQNLYAEEPAEGSS